MSLRDYVSATEDGFRAYAAGDAEVPHPGYLTASEGTFHAKSARLTLDRAYVAVKLNANFPQNPQRNDLPTIQGVLVLFDATNGMVLAVLDSIEVTLRRTAAASALAARHLARPNSGTITLCGCGAQGRAQLEALADVLPIRQVSVWDIDGNKAQLFAREMRGALRLDVNAVAEPHHAACTSDVIVTATSARKAFLTRDMVPAGAFVAAVGADNPEKSELTPELLAASTLVVDILGQAATMGDLHHAIEAGLVTADEVHAELADVIVGRKSGRLSDDQTIVFDSTGTAIQDVASAVAIWQRATASNVGSSFQLGAL